MKTNQKRNIIIIVTILLISTLTGCAPTSAQGNNVNVDNNINLKLARGVVKDLYIDAQTNKEYIILVDDINKIEYKIDITESEKFNDIEESKNYLVAIDVSDNKLISIEEEILTENSETNPEKSEIKYSTILSETYDIDLNGVTILDEYNIDINNDDTEDRIILTTTAGKDSNGNMMWDDGQNWKLDVIIKEEGNYKIYTLIDEYVQLGSLQFMVYKTGELGDEFKIAVLDERTANLSLDIYSYNRDADKFEKTPEYNAEGNVVMLYKSK